MSWRQPGPGEVSGGMVVLAHRVVLVDVGGRRRSHLVHEVMTRDRHAAWRAYQS